MRVVVAWLLLITRLTFGAKGGYEFLKCCGENEQLDSETLSCIVSPHSTLWENSTKNLAKTTFDLLGDPYKFLYTGINTLSLIRELEITKTFLVESKFAEKWPEVKNYVGGVLIDEQRNCIDISVKHNRSLVLVLGVTLKAIRKCCKKNERLSKDANHCEQIPGRNPLDADQEIIDTTQNDYSWIPKKIPRGLLKVKYNFMLDSNKYKWNWEGKENDFPWELRGTTPGSPAIIVLKNTDALWNTTESYTELFCFEEVSEGPLSPRAVFAAVYDVLKCCGKGMQLSNDLSGCSERPGIQPDNSVEVDEVNWQKNPDDAFWLPKKLRNSSLSVKYWKLFPGSPECIYNEDVWTLEKYYGVPHVKLNMTFLSGESYVFGTSEFCFEYVADAVRVLVVKWQFFEDAVSKCCYPGEVISANGYCIKHNGSDWTPVSSEARGNFDPVTTSAGSVRFPLRVRCERFSIHSINSSRAFEHFGGKHSDVEKWKTVNYCSDLLQMDNGVEEVVGSCDDAPTANIYEKIRPLGMVSAILLAAAGLLAVAQSQTRRSAHGRALACHALCLSAANVLQMVWFFTSPGQTNNDFNYCAPYAFSIFFFMTAANFWLTSISVNMAKGFRQHLGAMAHAARHGGNVAWKHFAFMSLFAWGGSLLFTSFAVTIHSINLRRDVDLGFVTPTFFETRTCGYEIYYQTFAQGEKLEDRLGALCYYYVPAAILVVVNGVCVFLTGYTLRSLQKDKQFLQRDTKETQGCIPQQTLQNALLYTKLLFTAGITELVVEAMGWAFAGQRRMAFRSASWLDINERIYIFAIITTFVDLVRAITVLWLCSGKQGCNTEALRKMKGYLIIKWNGLKRLCSHNSDIEMTHL